MPTLLFLHGWGCDENIFNPIATFLKSHFKCIFVNFDCNPSEVMTLEDYAAQVENILDGLEIEKCSVIAHSFGARVAMLMSARNPELFERMVLTGAAGLRPRFNLKIWLKIKLYKLKKKLFKHASGGSEDYKKLSDTGKMTFQNIINRDLFFEIKNNNVPSLLIWGKKDRATPLYMAKKWTIINKSARLVTYEKAGHFCFLDAPARFITDSYAFLVEEKEGE